MQAERLALRYEHYPERRWTAFIPSAVALLAGVLMIALGFGPLRQLVATGVIDAAYDLTLILLCLAVLSFAAILL